MSVADAVLLDAHLTASNLCRFRVATTNADLRFRAPSHPHQVRYIDTRFARLDTTRLGIIIIFRIDMAIDTIYTSFARFDTIRLGIIIRLSTCFASLAESSAVASREPTSDRNRHLSFQPVLSRSRCSHVNSIRFADRSRHLRF